MGVFQQHLHSQHVQVDRSVSPERIWEYFRSSDTYVSSAEPADSIQNARGWTGSLMSCVISQS